MICSRGLTKEHRERCEWCDVLATYQVLGTRKGVSVVLDELRQWHISSRVMC